MKAEHGNQLSDGVIKEVDLNTDRDKVVSLIESVGLSSEYVDNADVWLGYSMDGALVGCMALERRGDLVHIQSLSTHKEYRRRGIAKTLINRGFENYLKPGDMLVALTLFWNIEVYERMGFHKVNAKEMKKKDDIGGREKHKYCVAMVKPK